MRYLIIGGGIHAKRYTEALLFQDVSNQITVCTDPKSQYYHEISSLNVPIISKDDIDSYLGKTNCIILADFPETRIKTIEMLSNVPKDVDFIIEKPSTMCKEDEKYLQDFLFSKRYLVAYSRFFLEEIKNDVYRASYNQFDIYLDWPNFSFLGIHPLRDTLPHVLDLLFILLNVEDSYDCSFLAQGHNYHLDVKNNNFHFHVCLYDSKDKSDKIRLNDHKLSWPNYFHSIHAMVDCLIKNDIQLIQKNHIVNSVINQILFSIYEERGMNLFS